MITRQYLKNTILLCGQSDGTTFKRRFIIVKKINEGASAVCYEAYHENSGRGVLKEFYPKDAYALERNKEGQLIHSAEFQNACERFRKAEEEYIAPYEMLLTVKQKSSHESLATFIPAFEIYHGCDENGNAVGTVYIWSPEPKLQTFDKICEDIHKHPGVCPEHKLVVALSAIESLTKCIRDLHCADMIHRDIKPSNFGFMKRGDEALTQTLSMFDFNTVCSVYGNIGGVMGTEGYLEPEAGYEPVSNQTDIYAIGATLFHAIIVSDEVKENGYLYCGENYESLRRLVDSSRLIRGSEANSHPRLRNILTIILQKCLCERTYRYANCEELLEDLETALYYALPSDIARQRKSGEKWILADAEKSLDVNKEKNSMLAIRYHLYEHPLYECIPPAENAINVLLVGLGNYGQKFLDVCLQAGQIRGKQLNITVLSDDETDKNVYLAERPELAAFFNIDNTGTDGKEPYGNITFEMAKIRQGDQKANADSLKAIISHRYGTQSLSYVFVALGEDQLNLAAAKACWTAVAELQENCIISYVCENQTLSADSSPTLCPLFVNKKVKASDLYSEIERMAFNVHLVWEKNLNGDYSMIRREFRKPYNHDSCVSNVLSLKYKLYSLGIDLDLIGFDAAASIISNLLCDKKHRKIRDELIWMEHRRWVTEKLCLGWQSIPNVEDCLTGLTKDAKQKRHICILRSHPNQKLADEYKINGNYAKWDTATDQELCQLDDLDRMSVMLHRAFVKRAENAKKQNLLSGSNVAGIRMLIEDNKQAVLAFQEWFSCMKDIWNGDIQKVHLYKGLKQSFLNATGTLAAEKKDSVREQVKALEAIFYPVMASIEYQDFKQYDADLIDNIPFILTYTEKAYMVIPYHTGSHTEIFENVTAATVVNPERIIYLYLIDDNQSLQQLQGSLPYVIGYMNKKRLKASVEMLVICPYGSAHIIPENFDEQIQEIGADRIRQVKHLVADDFEELSKKLKAYLKQRSAGRQVFTIEKNNTRLSYLLQGAGFYQAFANYRFDSHTLRFNSLRSCNVFGYIRKQPYITVMDMAAFQLSANNSINQPEFFEDYKELWAKYRENTGAWKSLCGILSRYADEHDVIAAFPQKNYNSNNGEFFRYRYIIPFACNKSVEKILYFLKEQGIAEKESRVNGYTTGSCEVLITTKQAHQKEYDKLFSNVYALMEPDAITMWLNTKTQIAQVRFDNLIVSGVVLPEKDPSDLKELMQFFKTKGYLSNLIISNNQVSFTYATSQIKELLTTAGKMLEVYTYHKAKELGTFDDVVSSFKIDWEGTKAKSEFDCILTKGFRALFVECQVRSNIEQDFYFKMSSLAAQFGINATAVLIADTQEQSFYDHAPINAMQRKCGSMIDVVTVWKPNEISNIGHTLLKIINGNYVQEEG